MQHLQIPIGQDKLRNRRKYCHQILALKKWNYPTPYYLGIGSESFNSNFLALYDKEKQVEKKENIYSDIDEMISNTLKDNEEK